MKVEPCRFGREGYGMSVRNDNNSNNVKEANMAWDTIIKTSVDAIVDGEDFDLDELASEHVAMLADKWVEEVREEYIVEMSWYPGYANGDDSGHKGIIAANWNRVSNRIQRLVEAAGFTIEWCDAVCACGGCYKAIQTQPSHYGWKPEFVQTDGDVLCEDCVSDDAEFLIEDLCGNENKALTLESVNLADHGFVRVERDYEHGWHAGQDDSPKAIAANLRERGVEDFIFVLDSTGQFDAQFSVWVREEDADKAAGVEGKCEVAPNVALANALRSIPAPTGQGIHYTTVHADGSTTTRTLTNEEFIEGVRE
jgi:hypothetical protein